MKITQPELENHLFKATDLIRGRNDSYDVKEYIFGMLFLKRCNDTFEERRAEVINEQLLKGKEKGEAVKIAEDKMWYKSSFYVPPTSRWSYLISQAHQNIGNHLNEALGGLEQGNSSLQDVLEYIDFNRRTGKKPLTDALLREFINHFDQLNFSDKNLENSDVLGEAFESLLGYFAESAGKKAGEFYTPRAIVKLLVKLANPENNTSIYDPFCGSASMLVEAKKHIASKTGGNVNLDLYGQEVAGVTWSIAKMNLLFSGVPLSHLTNDDTLESPAHINSDGKLAQFDTALSIPPFSCNFGTREQSLKDDFKYPERFKYGSVPLGSKKADLMFLQHMLATCKANGKVVSVVPFGALFRSSDEKQIRSGMVEDDLLEAVIALPSGLFYGTGIPAAILVLNKNKPEERKQQTLFVDASHDYTEVRYANRLRPEDIQKMTSAYFSYATEGSYSKLVHTEEIRDNDYDLSVRCYVDNSPVLRRINELNAHYQAFKEYAFSSNRKNCAVKSINSPSDSPRSNTVVISKMARGTKQCIEHDEIGTRNKSNFFEIQFDENIVSSAYVKLFFESELGKLTLSHLPRGTTMPMLNRQDLESLTIFIPSKNEQNRIIDLARKLDVAREQLTTYKSDLLTKPALYQEVESRTDDFVYELSTLDEVSRVKQLIKINETQRIEFKQTFFVNADHVGREFKKTDKEYKKSCKAEQYKIAKNIATFLNTDGGTLLIGVTDDSQVCGIEKEMQHIKEIKAEAYIKRLSQDVANLIGERNNNWVEYCSVEVDDKTIVVIDCKPATKPVLLPNKNKDGTIHNEPTELIIRRGTASVTLNGYELLEYIDSHFKK
ncbi:N-6 DNA methylase [Psychrobium sp. 1_MG-2023]|uniref:N-6 DNA methylase n=1 Tax=Psychrobium sp. 1_MG-2023 TaxID=3062624 RepID=UPI00273568E6|nr:N-6 DNA methylase [Psychrobium sp. 1_MG-2023]MDP2560419.1 N-6 DNA methylase [Psychrobium sp. 1_MG-2023]